MKPSECWNAAADHIDQSGWTRGDLGSPGGARCALGALLVVASETSQAADAIRAMAELIGGGFDGAAPSVARWNDAMIVDKEHAVAWLRASAAEMREFGL